MKLRPWEYFDVIPNEPSYWDWITPGELAEHFDVGEMAIWMDNSESLLLFIEENMEGNELMETLKLHRFCVFCRQPNIVEVPATKDQIKEWNSPNRRHIQFIFPNLSTDVREEMISGTHPACWDELFSTEDGAN